MVEDFSKWDVTEDGGFRLSKLGRQRLLAIIAAGEMRLAMRKVFDRQRRGVPTVGEGSDHG